jgi:hypothetical protein
MAITLWVAWRLYETTEEGNTLWYVSESKSAIAVHGKPSHGWLHWEWRRRSLFVTRDSPAKRESYLVVLPDADMTGYVGGCNGWTAPHFPLFPFFVRSSDGLLCDGFDTVRGPDRELTVGLDSLHFVADDDRIIEARWK